MDELPVELVEISKLKAWPDSWHQGDVGAISQSIEANEWYGTIIVNKRKGVETSNTVLAGNHRLFAAQALGYEKLPVYWVDKSDDEATAIAIADNRASGLAIDDLEKLAEQLKELNEKDMLSNTLYDGDDIDAILEKINSEDLFDESALREAYSQVEGKVTYEPKESRHKPADLFQPNNEMNKDIDELENEELKLIFKARQVYFGEFDFEKIADYYAFQATPQEQRLFEKLGLVLLDKNQLIENGFSNLLRNAERESA